MAVTWNPSDKNANISLSNGNLTYTATATSWKSVRATDFKSSGKWYWEITIDVAASNHHIFGAGTADADINSYVGSNVYGYGYNGYDGKKFYNGGSVAYGSVYGLNDVISVALDLDNGKIWWAKNGVWQASGDPAAGTNEAFSGLSGSFYPMGSPYTNTNAATANFGGTAFSYSMPSGFKSLGYYGYFSGYVYEESESNPVSRQVYCYNRSDGALMNSTTSSGNGYYYLETTYSGSHFIVALDDTSGTQYNLVGLDYMIPVTIS